MGAHPPEGAREDLHLAVTDPEIKAVFASIGGADAIRVLPHLDPGVMAANPKIFMGYSDTTMVRLAAYGAGLQTFYGPAVMAGITENGGMFEYAERWFRKVPMTSEPVGKLEPAEGWTEERLEWADPTLENQRRTLRKPDGWVWLQGGAKAEGHLLTELDRRLKKCYNDSKVITSMHSLERGTEADARETNDPT